MGFPNDEVQQMLAIKGVGPTVIRRLEEIGFSSLAELSGTNPLAINKTVAQMLRASCWANSPLAKNAIAAVVDLANEQHPAPPTR